MIEQLDAKMLVHQEKIKLVRVNNSARTIGVYLNLALFGKRQFEIMR